MSYGVAIAWDKSHACTILSVIRALEAPLTLTALWGAAAVNQCRFVELNL